MSTVQTKYFALLSKCEKESALLQEREDQLKAVDEALCTLRPELRKTQLENEELQHQLQSTIDREQVNLASTEDVTRPLHRVLGDIKCMFGRMRYIGRGI